MLAFAQIKRRQLRLQVYRVLAKALMTGTEKPVNDYLKMVNKQKITIRDINPKAVSTQARS